MTGQRSWTASVRERAEGSFPPEQLLPDRQPAYVASWIYVFGALSLAAFVAVLTSGAVLALGGPQWYHGSSAGLFVNSLHLWSVELFFFFMVIHLWGKFWMAAWRGRRAATWITGVIAFILSVATAFTGYLIQSNFDSQWIATQAKDGINSVGIGSRFNVLDYGQMLLFHALLLPLVVGALIGLHVLLVRRRGVVPPLDQPRDSVAVVDDSAPWPGPWRPYDLIKELVICVVVAAVLVVGLSVVFGSPDDRAVTLQSWSKAAPSDFVLTAASELDGTSGSASYGAPYNHNGPGQKLGPLSLERWAGVTIPVDSAHDFVVSPLQGIPGDAQLGSALAAWGAAGADGQTTWATNYDTALQKAPGNDPARVAAGDYGPVPIMLGRLLNLARSGGLDGALLAQGRFYQTDYTKPLLFIADGTYLQSLAADQGLLGSQWGMMNETGRYPGQAWLWLYTFWYQVKPFSTSGNGDALVWAVMMLLTLGLIFVPLIPGVRSIPRWIPVHRLIWRSYYRDTPRDPPSSPMPETPRVPVVATPQPVG
jgi:cytochrome b/b6/petB-like protein